jgi:F-type H+-transporting ATPase subunit b
LFNIVLSIAPEIEDKSRLFGLDGQTLIQIGMNLFNVGLLAFILTKLLYKPVRGFMAKRSEKIKSQLDHAMDESAKATELRLQYEQKLLDIDKSRDEILDEARKQAVENGRVILAEAKAEADALKARAHATVEMEWERAQEEMRLAILNVSAAMAGKMVVASMSKEAHEKLFDETMTELEGTSWRS